MTSVYPRAGDPCAPDRIIRTVPDPTRDDDATDTLGPLLCRRRASRLYLVVLLFFAAFMVAAPAAFVGIVQQPGRLRIAAPLALAAPFMAIGLVGSFLSIRELRTRVDFHQHACVRRRGRQALIVRYDQARSFRFKVTRQYTLFVHLNSTVAIDLRGPGRARIRYSGTLREKSRGFFSLSRNGADELLLVRAVIASRMGAIIVDSLLSGSVVRWGDAAILTDEGLTPTHGPFKGSLLPYSAITREGQNDDQFALFLDDDDRPVAAFSMNAANFAPCCAAFHVLQERALRGDGPWIRLCVPIAGALPNQAELDHASELADRLDILLRENGRGMIARVAIAENPDRQEFRFVILCRELADVTDALERLLEWAELPEGACLLFAPDDQTEPERIDLA